MPPPGVDRRGGVTDPFASNPVPKEQFRPGVHRLQRSPLNFQRHESGSAQAKSPDNRGPGSEGFFAALGMSGFTPITNRNWTLEEVGTALRAVRGRLRRGVPTRLQIESPNAIRGWYYTPPRERRGRQRGDALRHSGAQATGLSDHRTGCHGVPPLVFWWDWFRAPCPSKPPRFCPTVTSRLDYALP